MSEQLILDKITGPRKFPKKKTVSRGYAAPIGSGPEGETCGTCAHIVRKRMGKTYLKCGLMQAIWTGGPGTDIKARAPACREWARFVADQ